jgi:hypothetical protein
MLCIIGGHLLTAEGIVGKIVIFICEKTVGKLIQLPFDKRKKACRSLTKLYYSVQCLDDVTDAIYRTVEDFKDNGDAFAVVNALNNHKHEVELATNMFVDLGHELSAGLEIVDPVLAQCCNVLYVGKFDFLTFMSKSIAWERTGDKAKIAVKVPQGLSEAVDMQDMYDRTNIALGKGEKFYWPDSAFDDFREDFQSFSIEWENNEAARQFLQMLSKQRETLTKAKTQLRELLKASFSIEEILFQTDSHPYK